MDERFVMHRLLSTRLSAVVGAVMMGTWTLYQFFARDSVRWEMVAILLTMGLPKWIGMAYYRRTK